MAGGQKAALTTTTITVDRVSIPFGPFSFISKFSKIVTKLKIHSHSNDERKYKYPCLESIQKSKLPVRENYLTISMKVSAHCSKEL